MLFEPILISRTVNYFYLMLVILLGIAVFSYCLYRKYYRKDGQLLILYVWGVVIWALIESVCVFAGFRTYSENQVFVFLIIVLCEDPAWVVLAYAGARFMCKIN